MYVCICHGVTNTKIKELVQGGAASLDEVTKQCAAGSDCGSCRFKVNRIIRETMADLAETSNFPSESAR